MSSDAGKSFRGGLLKPTDLAEINAARTAAHHAQDPDATIANSELDAPPWLVEEQRQAARAQAHKEFRERYPLIATLLRITRLRR